MSKAVEVKWKRVGLGSAGDVCKSSNRSGKREKCGCKNLGNHQNTTEREEDLA